MGDTMPNLNMLLQMQVYHGGFKLAVAKQCFYYMNVTAIT